MVSGFQRPVICLIGAPGVGRRSLRNMLIRANRERYASAIARKLIRNFLFVYKLHIISIKLIYFSFFTILWYRISQSVK